MLVCLLIHSYLCFIYRFSNKNKKQPTSSTAATSSGDVQEAEASLTLDNVEDVGLDRDAEEDEEDNECEIMDKEDKRSLMDDGGKDVPEAEANDIEDVERDEEVLFSFEKMGYQAKTN